MLKTIVPTFPLPQRPFLRTVFFAICQWSNHLWGNVVDSTKPATLSSIHNQIFIFSFRKLVLYLVYERITEW